MKNTDAKSLKVAFFGTSDRSTPILEALKANFDLALCITKEDVRIGRHQNLKKSGVKDWALQNNVPFIELGAVVDTSWNSAIEVLKKHKITYGIVTDFSFIIPKRVINHFKGKLINIHFSLLPKYRGACPVQFALLNGDTQTGITYQLVHPQLDRGDVLHQVEYAIPEDKTAGELYTELFGLAAKNLPKVVTGYAKKAIVPKAQDENQATYTYSPSHPTKTTIFKEDGRINWTNTSTQLHNFVRAFNPWPIAWTTLTSLEKNYKPQLKLKPHVAKNLRLRIFRTKITEKGLAITELQVEGKRKMSWAEFENGYLEAS